MDDTWKPAGGIAVTEFGFAEPFEQDKQLLGDIRFDLARSAYYDDYMQAILIAISEGVNVVGALAWSIVDNLEWVSRVPFSDALIRLWLGHANIRNSHKGIKSNSEFNTST